MNDEYRISNLLIRHSTFEIHYSIQFSGDCIGRVTPVPIPNTAVKPTGADDTAAFSCGKVGSRRIYFKEKPARFEWAFSYLRIIQSNS